MPNSRRKYDEEFKRRAVRLSYSSERTIKATAESLGINANMLHRWRSQYTPDGNKALHLDNSHTIEVVVKDVTIHICNNADPILLSQLIRLIREPSC